MLEAIRMGWANRFIKHKIDKDGKYVCIKATSTTPEKSTHDWDKVTCKNCLAKKPKMKYGYEVVERTCIHCGTKYECHVGTVADRTSCCHKCNPHDKVLNEVKAINKRLAALEPDNECCSLCGEKYDENRIVNYTGKPVCRGCAKSIAEAFLSSAK